MSLTTTPLIVCNGCGATLYPRAGFIHVFGARHYCIRCAHPQESNEPREAPPQGQHPSGHKQEQDDER